MKKENIFAAIIGLAVGLAIGFFAANSINRNAISQTTATNSVPISPNAPPTNSSAAATAPNNGGMMPDVQEKLDRAQNEPQNFAAQMNAGDMYAQIGRYDKAFEFYQRGVALKPGDFQANVQLANAYFDNRQFENAEKYYAAALLINPNDVNARTDLGTTFVERQNPDYDRAVKEFQKVLEIDPKHEPTLYNLAVAYNRMNKGENAKETLDKLEQTNPNSQLLARLKQLIAEKN